MKTIVAAAIIAAALPSAAMAQETSAFGGLYVGALAGYDSVTLGDGDEDESKDGVAYGVVVGYDANLGGAVVGVEAELSDSTTKEEQDGFRLTADRDIYVGARVGFAVTPVTLVYAKGGYTNARATVSIDDVDFGTFSESDNVDGYRLGAGIEQSFGRFSARVEYRYSDYGQFEIDGEDTGIEASRHQVVAALTARF